MGSAETSVKKMPAKKDMPMICACTSSFAFLGMTFIAGIAKALSFAPLLFAIPVLVYLITKEKKNGIRAEVIMNEAPAAIGMIRLMTDSGRSLDSAVRETALNGPPNIAKMFSEIVWNVDVRLSSDIRSSMNRMLASLPRTLASFRRSMYLLMSASDSKDANERRRMTKDANDIILAGLKELGESYSSKLNAPCMVIFGLGVMVPMILVSILPMLSIGGQFSSSSVDPAVIAVVTLLIIPAAVAGVIMMIASKNPFYIRSGEKIELMNIAPAAVCVPVLIIAMNMTSDIVLSAAAAAITAGLALFITLDPHMRKERKKAGIESILCDALFDVGNRLLSGENFETALISSFKERKDSGTLSAALEKSILVSRGDTASAIHAAMAPYSKRMADMYCDVFRSSLKDLRDAGRLAVSIGHQLQDQAATVSGIQNKLRSMLDMMTGTSAVFAPLILGISVSMLAPLMDLAGGAQASSSPILMIYLMELAALISVLTTQLKCRGGILSSLYQFSIMMPVALIIFMITSSIGV